MLWPRPCAAPHAGQLRLQPPLLALQSVQPGLLLMLRLLLHAHP
jgi:hypothetical protein